MRYQDGHIQFHDGTRLAYDQPKNTMDPRYKSCTTHHTACICREAEYAEEVHEYRTEWRGFRDALAEVIAEHAACCCQCTACALARRLGLTHLSKGDHCND